MDYLPLFAKLAGHLVVVVGGGEVAARKIALLRRADAKIRVIAPELEADLRRLLSDGAFEHRAEAFTAQALDGARLVIAATDDGAVNGAVAEAAAARGLFVNVVDDPARCTVIMPSIVDRGRVVAAISTGGAAPVLARLMRRRIEEILPDMIGQVADWSARHRDRIRAIIPEQHDRRHFWEWLLDGDGAVRIAADPTWPPDEAARAWLNRPAGALVAVSVPAEADLLSLRAVRQIFTAELVLYQPGVAPSSLDHARRDSRILAVSDHAAAEMAATPILQQGGRAVFLYPEGRLAASEFERGDGPSE